jgi:AraC-like DNA-binding protein/mannose-6-phosphate isomerase-like protein (cupin superfamily)
MLETIENSPVSYSHFQPLEQPENEVRHFSFRSHFMRPYGMAFYTVREYLKTGTHTGWHCHDDFYNLSVIRSGRGTVTINDQSYAVLPGDVFIVAPGSPHCARNYQDIELDAFYFQTQLFTRAELSALRQNKGFWKLLQAVDGARSRRDGERRLHLSPERHRAFDELVLRIHSDLFSPAPLGPMLARNQFFCLLARLAQWHAAHDEEHATTRKPSELQQRVATQSTHATSLGDVVRFCEENLDQPLTVPQMAGKMFLSPDHFARLFTAEMGIPPAAYLRRLRLERARVLLRTTTLSIAEIASRCGWRDSNQLTHAFRNAYHVTPSGYRTKPRN